VTIGGLPFPRSAIAPPSNGGADPPVNSATSLGFPKSTQAWLFLARALAIQAYAGRHVTHFFG
jgi:hypothetical protein